MSRITEATNKGTKQCREKQREQLEIRPSFLWLAHFSPLLLLPCLRLWMTEAEQQLKKKQCVSPLPCVFASAAVFLFASAYLALI